MKGLRIIGSVVFLSLFGMMNLHNVVPHVHHSHADDQVEAHHHSHGGHAHHHDHEHSDDTGLDDIFLVLFGDHIHSFQVQHIDINVRLAQTQQVLPFNVLIPSGVIEFTNVDQVHRYYLFKPRIAQRTVYSSKSLRAPPVLG